MPRVRAVFTQSVTLVHEVDFDISPSREVTPLAVEIQGDALLRKRRRNESLSTEESEALRPVHHGVTQRVEHEFKFQGFEELTDEKLAAPETSEKASS